MLASDLPSAEKAPTPTFDHARWRLRVVASMAVYMLWTAFVVGLRVEHWVIAITYAGSFWVGPRAARLVTKLTPFLLVGIVYESLPLFTTMHATVHVADVHFAEIAFFGIHGNQGAETIAHWFQRHTHPIADALCGFAYFFYIVEALLFAVFLFFKHDQYLKLFGWSFLCVNVLGMLTWVMFPVAPPWYVDAYGLGSAILDAPASAAGALRFDALIGFDYFEIFYSRNTYIFGAMPSLHTSYPAVVFLSAKRLGRPYAIATGLFTLWVGFSALYLNHHYLLDVLAGLLYALLAHAIAGRIFNRHPA